MKIASFLAKTTSHMAQGSNVWRQHKNSRHCEEERRGNLPYFFLRLAGYTQVILACPLSLVSCFSVLNRLRPAFFSRRHKAAESFLNALWCCSRIAFFYLRVLGPCTK